MKMGYCPKCKSSCEITFVTHVTGKNGKKIYPKQGKKCLVIPQNHQCKS